MHRLVAVLLTVLTVLSTAGPATAAPGRTGAAPVRLLPASAPAGLPQVWPGLLEVELSGVGATVQRLVATTPGVLRAVPAFPGSSDEALSRWLSVQVRPGSEADVTRLLSAVPGVAAVAPTPVRVPAYEPNDPQRPQQWHLDRIGARGGWAVSRGDRRVRLGVIDTQFDTHHPELRGALFRRNGSAGVETVGDGCRASTPYSEHGTFVAGIAAAATDNRSGVASVGFSIGIVAVQAGTELDGSCLISPEWSRSLVDLADAGVPVVNLSFAGERSSGSEAAAVRYATSKGTLVVAAAGNSGSTTPHYPAAHPLALGVAATGDDDRLWASSNRGSWVDVAAPGVKLLTICPGGYCVATGTSTAAPVVASIATLLVTAQPDLAGLQLRARVIDAAAEVTGQTVDPSMGYGRARLDRTMVQRSVRLYGRDRVDTAQAVARETHPGGDRAATVTRVVLVPADTAGDRGWTVTLPAAGLLADGRTAMVMTGRDRLSASAAVELDRLLGGTGEIVLPGAGQLGVSAAVEGSLRAAGYTVKRLGTGDVAGTAAALADEVSRGSRARAALIASGDTFADALSLAAAAAAHGYPLLYVGADSVPAATCEWIADHREVSTLHLAGGPRAISPAVETQLEACTSGLLDVRSLTITRDAGASRVETSIAVARRHFGTGTPTVAIANGFKWPDAVTGGSLAVSAGAPVLLTGGQALEAPLQRHLATAGVRRSYVLGGPAVVSDATRAAIETATR